MSGQIDVFDRRTSADVVFDHLRREIDRNQLSPGTKISETEVASRFGVSRQPVRDAFNRLANLDLLLIRPQKATEVRGFSTSRISQARFVRLAVELEVVRRACEVWDDARAKPLDKSLARQRKAIESGEVEEFHKLDYDFHKMICALSGNANVFETIHACKAKIDRLCLLSLTDATEMPVLLQDHQSLADALLARDAEECVRIVRTHLSRLDRTIRDIREEHSEYFED